LPKCSTRLSPREEVTKSLIKTLLFCLILSLAAVAFAQETADDDDSSLENLPVGVDLLEEFIRGHVALKTVDTNFSQWPFLRRELNEIPGADSLLAPFLFKMMELRGGLREQVTIYQFGGSHIKPGWFAGATENLFDNFFEEQSENPGAPGFRFLYKGINGASFTNQFNNDEVFASYRDLKPDLIVISMGTNDAQGTYSAQRFHTALTKYMEKMYKYSGDTPILFTLPPDSYKNGVPNPDVVKVANEIKAYAAEHGHAWWDLQQVMGGPGSFSTWQNQGIGGKDMVHFNAQGYRLQGQLLYEALLRAYKSYAERGE